MSVFGSYEPFASCCAPSSSLVTITVSIPHWDVKSDYPSPVSESPVLISIRDFFTHRHAHGWIKVEPRDFLLGLVPLCGSFMEKDESEKGESELLPEWSSLCCNLRQRYDCHESDSWTMTGSVKTYYEALAFC